MKILLYIFIFVVLYLITISGIVQYSNYTMTGAFTISKIKVGQIWIENVGDGNPFETKTGHTNRVLAVKSGWVQFEHITEWGSCVFSERTRGFGLWSTLQ